MIDDFVLRSKMLARAGFSHGFFTRARGRSAGLADVVNFAVGESAETGARNLGIAAGALGVEPARLYFASQVHGREVALVEGNEDRSVVLRRAADAVVSRIARVACGVRVADCVSVLVANRATGAVAAIHSGWQGTVLRVVEAGVDALCPRASERAGLIAAIFPHIEVCCFEVGEDVAQKLVACSPATAERVVDRARGPKPHLDLRVIVRAQLCAAGIVDPQIEDVPGCTVCDSTRFFSYRREREHSGRHLAAIVATGP